MVRTVEPTLQKVLALPAIEAAPLLVGAELYVRGVGGVLTEVEAYDDTDPASHCYGGPRGRNMPMFLPGGHIYVYRSYGIHWCMNLVTGAEGKGEAVLLRGLHPMKGIEDMRKRRGDFDDHLLARGPGNLTKALGVTDAENATRLGGSVILTLTEARLDIVIARRIGVNIAVDEKRRFFLKGSRCVTRPSYV
jgi:DNA-3-methyladenine glycosylase